MKSRSWFAGLQMPELLGGVERHLGKQGVRGRRVEGWQGVISKEVDRYSQRVRGLCSTQSPPEALVRG